LLASASTKSDSDPFDRQGQGQQIEKRLTVESCVCVSVCSIRLLPSNLLDLVWLAAKKSAASNPCCAPRSLSWRPSEMLEVDVPMQRCPLAED
jgi:hypothetical protein